MKIAIFPGDGIGYEVIAEAVKVLRALDLPFEFEWAAIGGVAYRESGHPLPASTVALAQAADAVLFGAVGDPALDELPRHLRPEQAILGLRRELALFANLRPAIAFASLLDASPLKTALVAGMNLLIVRELTGDVYFGTPRGRRSAPDGPFAGAEEGFDTMRYSRPEVERIARVAFRMACGRHCKVLNVDKSNVLETSALWRQVVMEVHAAEFPQVDLAHQYVDNAAMQLVREPARFDVVLAGNLFGDILSDLAAMLTGSIGMLASASLDGAGKGLYEPGHGSAPDIAGSGRANPLATILSAALMLRHSLGQPEAALHIEQAVAAALQKGYRTPDIRSPGCTLVDTSRMGDAVVAALRDILPE